MLRLKSITKDYVTSDSSVKALRGIDLSFRESEFVSVLGPSGCGKTTLLNIIGGLDQYTTGDLIIQGRSTKEFRDADWDSYRNHSVGFVFQNYNLIAHQSVLSNVELALTLSGVSKGQRRERAIEALKKVGLEDQMAKRPNQLSGGQMQRVAIARALVNDPKILLADEPTGALDSATSLQIMELLKEIAADRLVIMVTHNPDLARAYSTRIIKLLDGEVTDDSDPFTDEETAPALSRQQQKEKRLLEKTASMSFLTALSLSLNNLMTKKTRTALTAFAGSIGIIGIALILSVSTGVQNYIDRVQQDTLSSYPIILRSETYDMSSVIAGVMGVPAEARDHGERGKSDVHVSSVVYEMMNSMNAAETTRNNLGAFRKYLESHDEFRQYASSIQYAYDTNLNIMVRNIDGQIVKSDILDLFQSIYASIGMTIPESAMTGMSRMQVWEELLSGEDGELINPLLFEQYDLLYGRWPDAADELVLVVDENNEITDMTLYALGLRTGDELMQSVVSAQMGEQLDLDALRLTWTYEDLCGVTLRYIAPADCYQRQENGTYLNLAGTQTGLEFLYDGDAGLTLKVVGIIRASDDAISSMLGGSLAYTRALTDYILQNTADNPLVQAQLADPDTDAISGLPFEGAAELTDAEKAEAAGAVLTALPNSEKAALYERLMSEPDEETVAAYAQQVLAATGAEDLNAMMRQMFAQQTGADEATIQSYLDTMDDETRQAYLTQAVSAMAREQYAAQIRARLAAMSEESLAAGLDKALPSLDEATAAALYDEFAPRAVSDSTYENNLKLLGYVDPESPSAISIYAATFADKEALDQLIEDYNASVSEEDQLSYTDYIALMMSSVSTIINAISYVLIAFVAISLVVSSIMIGIITYISVLERTKEIGILRAIGASKRDISRVFNAETVSIGFIAGAIGIGVTLLLTIPINLILHHFTGIMILNATLPAVGAVVLVAISILLTFIAGLIPSGIAARKDPVIALRTE